MVAACLHTTPLTVCQRVGWVSPPKQNPTQAPSANQAPQRFPRPLFRNLAHASVCAAEFGRADVDSTQRGAAGAEYPPSPVTLQSAGWPPSRSLNRFLQKKKKKNICTSSCRFASSRANQSREPKNIKEELKWGAQGTVGLIAKAE